MKKYIICFYLLLSVIVYGQSPSLGWVKNIGGSSWSITIDSDENVYTIGYFNGTVDFDPSSNVFNLSSNGASDIFISKLDSAGNFIWAKKMGGTSNDFGYGVVVDNYGSIYLTGNFTGTADFDPSSNTYNLTSFGLADIFICKIDTSGNFIWVKQIGGIYDDMGADIDVDILGNVYTTGYFRDIVDFDSSLGVFNLISNTARDVFINKLDSTGNFVWAKNMGGPDFGGFDIKVAKNCNVYIVGQFFGTKDFDPGVGTFYLTSNGVEDIFTCKLDSLGDFVWARSTGQPSNDGVSSIAIDNYENVYTTGHFSSTVDFDPGVGVFNLTAPGGAIFVSKLDKNGIFKWAKGMGSTLDNFGMGIALDSSQNVYTTGYFQGNVDFNPGINNYNISSNGYNDIFISKLDSLGNFIWAQKYGGANDDLGRDIIVSKSNNIYTTGYYQGTVDFDPGPNTFNVTPIGVNNLYILKLNSGNNISTKIDDFEYTNSNFKIIPNPNNGYFVVELNSFSEIKVTDVLGRLVYSKFSNHEKNNLDLTNQANGIYFLEVSSSGFKNTSKIIIDK
jgi:hypothetical protein